MRLLSNLISSNRILKSSQVMFDKANAVTIAHETVEAPPEQDEPELDDYDFFNNPGRAYELDIRAQGDELSEHELAERIVERAREEAAKIIESAREDAELILDRMEQDAREKIINLEDDARRNGYHEGLEKGESETEGIKEEARAMFANAKQTREASFAAFETDILELIIDIVHKLITDEVKINPHVILYLIRKGFSETKMGGDIIIRVSDEDYEEAYANRELLLQYADAGSKLDIIKDHSLAKSDCIMETPFGMIDCSLEHQLEALKKSLYFISENG
jgi:flagellar assembly protein FliH